MEFLFNADRPIYVQLVEALRRAVISGEVSPGQRLPSVRELALTAQVNPNTMQRALTQLEEEGLIYTERTNGKFVTQNESLICSAKQNLAREKARLFLEEMRKMGVSAAEAEQYLRELGGE